MVKLSSTCTSLAWTNLRNIPEHFNGIHSVCFRGQKEASSLYCQWWLYLIMLIMDQWNEDALSLPVKSTENSQGEVKCMWFFRKLRNPGRQCRTLLFETKELSSLLPILPIIRTLPPPNPDLCPVMGPTLCPHQADIPQVRSAPLSSRN